MAGEVGEGIAAIAEHAAVGVGFLVYYTGVVDEVFGAVAVGAVDDEVIFGEDGGGDGLDGGGGAGLDGGGAGQRNCPERWLLGLLGGLGLGEEGSGEELGDFYYSAVGVDGAQLFGGGDYLGSPHVGGEMDDLALKVAFIHYIAVHQAYCSHSRRSKIHRHRGAKSAAAYNEHPALSESLLSFPSYFLQQ